MDADVKDMRTQREQLYEVIDKKNAEGYLIIFI